MNSNNYEQLLKGTNQFFNSFIVHDMKNKRNYSNKIVTLTITFRLESTRIVP